MSGMKAPDVLRCSLCGAPFDADDAETFTALVFGTERRFGAYCGPSCRDGMRAVEALRGLRGDDHADSLLALYRSGRVGPSPTLVLESVRRASGADA
jgi:hypothetical protein